MMMGRYGRKAGFILGGGLAVIGGALCALALMQASFFLLCLGHAALGAALACYQYFRFAAAEVVSEHWQPIAISLMLTSGLIAAFAGPELFIMTKDYIPAVPLAGAYGALSAFSLIGIVPLFFMSKPALPQWDPDARTGTKIRAALWHRPVLTAIVIGTVSQAIMVLLMSPTPLAMIGCGFSEETAGDVIRWHVVAMFAPSFVTGFLIKRYGTTPIAVLGLVLSTAAAAIAAIGLTQPHFYGSLILLGVGWNFGIIGATTMLVKVVPTQHSAFIQGVNNTVIALVSTVCAFGSGAIVTSMSWTVLSLTAIPPLVLTVLFVAYFSPNKAQNMSSAK